MSGDVIAEITDGCSSRNEEDSLNDESFSTKEKNNEQPPDDVREVEHFDKIVDAFYYYKIHSLAKLRRELLSYKRLSKKHQNFIPSYVEHINHLRQCVSINYDFLKTVVKDVHQIFENRQFSADDADDERSTRRQRKTASDFNMEKLQSTLRQFARDWSAEGVEERAVCYQPILNDVQRIWPDDRENIKILVPGAGLGRLAFEITRMGYFCEGNEFSLFMLFSSNFILNRCKSANSWTLYPWIHQWTNNLSYEDQIRPLLIPDVDPSSSKTNSYPNNFSMSAGDFLHVYADDKNCWNCVASVFFIDTARNVIAYIEKIYELLVPGGYWINFGPLLYHFADMPDEDSIQLPYDEIKNVTKKIGFEFVEEILGLETTYTQNVRSILKYKYECVKFICRKPIIATN